MEHQFKVAVFDLDGTLLDTSAGVLSSVKYTIDKFGFKPLSDEMLSSFIGPPIQNSFANAYGLEGPILQEIANVFRNQYKDVDLLKAEPYDGIYEVFEGLLENNIKPAVATYKRQDYATTILRHFGFDKYTDILYGADNENKLKISGLKKFFIHLKYMSLRCLVFFLIIIEKALFDAGITYYKDAVMIGDSDNDAIGAHDIGVHFIGVTYGFGFKNVSDVEKYDNIGVATNTKELENLLVGGHNK